MSRSSRTRVLLLRARRAQLRGDGAERRVGALDMARLEIAHLAVVALEAELRHPLGKEATQRLEHLVAVAIARLDPGALLRRRHAPRSHQRDRRYPAHQIPFSSISTSDTTGP